MNYRIRKVAERGWGWKRRQLLTEKGVRKGDPDDVTEEADQSYESQKGFADGMRVRCNKELHTFVWRGCFTRPKRCGANLNPCQNKAGSEWYWNGSLRLLENARSEGLRYERRKWSLLIWMTLLWFWAKWNVLIGWKFLIISFWPEGKPGNLKRSPTFRSQVPQFYHTAGCSVSMYAL